MSMRSIGGSILCTFVLSTLALPTSSKGASTALQEKIRASTLQLISMSSGQVSKKNPISGIVINNNSSKPVFSNISVAKAVNVLSQDLNIQKSGFQYLVSVANNKIADDFLDFDLTAYLRPFENDLLTAEKIKTPLVSHDYSKISIPIHIVLQSKLSGTPKDVRELSFLAQPDVTNGIFPGYILIDAGTRIQVGYLLLKFDENDALNPNKNYIILNFMDYELGLQIERLVVLGRTTP